MGGNEHPRGVMGTTGKGTRNRGSVNTTRRLILVHFYPPPEVRGVFYEAVWSPHAASFIPIHPPTTMGARSTTGAVSNPHAAPFPPF